MGRVAILTACYGAFDAVHPQVGQDIDVDWIYVTDEPDRVVSDMWMTHTTTEPYDNPRLEAKTAKMTPWVIAPGYDYYVWIDASMEVTNPAFAREAIAAIPNHKFGGVAAWVHPRRDCIYDEAEASVSGSEAKGDKYDRGAILAQVAAYRGFEYPEHAGLFACGTIAWEPRWWRAKKLGRKWLEENRKWSTQDQVSFPVVARRCGVQPGAFPFPQMVGWKPVNPWLKIHGHVKQLERAR